MDAQNVQNNMYRLGYPSRPNLSSQPLRIFRRLIDIVKPKGRKVGICGQAPSDYPEFAAFLVEAGIDSMSLNPDSVIQVKRRVAEAEKNQ